MESNPVIIDDRLKALLIGTKKQDFEPTAENVIEILGDIYTRDMRLQDVMHHVISAYLDVLGEPRFSVGHDLRYHIQDLLFSPVKGYCSINGLRSHIGDSYKFEDVLLCQMKHMLSTIKLTKVDWCKKEVWGAE